MGKRWGRELSMAYFRESFRDVFAWIHEAPAYPKFPLWKRQKLIPDSPMQLLTLRYIGKFPGNGFTRLCDPVFTMYRKCHGGQALYVKSRHFCCPHVK